MKKIIPLFLLFIFILTIFIVYNLPTKVVEITYDNSPYKVLSKVKNSNQNYYGQDMKIYETLREKKNKNNTQTLLSIESPIKLKKNEDRIEELIDKIIEREKLANFQEINITFNPTNSLPSNHLLNNQSNTHYLSTELNIKLNASVALSLGIYKSRKLAEQMMSILQNDFEELSNYKMVLFKTSSKKLHRSFYRIVIFDVNNRGKLKNICQNLIYQNYYCIMTQSNDLIYTHFQVN